MLLRYTLPVVQPRGTNGTVDAIVDMRRPDEGDSRRELHVGKSRFDDCPAGTSIWVDWNDQHTYGYDLADDEYRKKGAKLPLAEVQGLGERVRKHLEKNPKATKASTARALGLDPANRHSASYRLMVEAFEAAKQNCV